MILKGCRIIIPGRKAIIADLEVRYTKMITLPDGKSINRAGVRFAQKPEGIEALFDMLAQNPDRVNGAKKMWFSQHHGHQEIMCRRSC